MAEQRSRLDFIFRPQGDDKAVAFLTRAALAMQGANSLTAITSDTHPELKSMLEDVSERAGMPAPRAFVWHSSRPGANAVAISGKTPAVAFSDDIIDMLSNEELTAVAAHELGHVKNMDHSGKLRILAGLGGAAAAWVATRPLKNMMHGQMAKDAMKGNTRSGAAQTIGFVKDMTIFTGAMAGSAVASRSEEFAADRYGAMLMQGDGVPLMSSLQKLEEFNDQHYRPTMLSKILKPYSKLTSSHPDFNARRSALGVSKEELAGYRAVNDATPPVEQAASAPVVEEPNQWQQRVAEEASRNAEPPSR